MRVIKTHVSANTPTVVEPGIHRAVLTKVNQFENHWGERLGFEFTIKETGETIMRTTTPKLTAKSKLAESLSELTHQTITPPRSIEPNNKNSYLAPCPSQHPFLPNSQETPRR